MRRAAGAACLPLAARSAGGARIAGVVRLRGAASLGRGRGAAGSRAVPVAVTDTVSRYVRRRRPAASGLRQELCIAMAIRHAHHFSGRAVPLVRVVIGDVASSTVDSLLLFKNCEPSTSMVC